MAVVTAQSGWSTITETFHFVWYHFSCLVSKVLLLRDRIEIESTHHSQKPRGLLSWRFQILYWALGDFLLVRVFLKFMNYFAVRQKIYQDQWKVDCTFLDSNQKGRQEVHHWSWPFETFECFSGRRWPLEAGIFFLLNRRWNRQTRLQRRLRKSVQFQPPPT